MKMINPARAALTRAINRCIAEGSPVITEEKMKHTYTATAKELAEKTATAYSADRFANWTGVARMLKTRGYSDQQAEAIMASKWPRWAGDWSGKPYGKVTSADLARWLDNGTSKTELGKLVQELTDETFGEEVR
jgi:hypothetical protein